jgi:phage shock protein E
MTPELNSWLAQIPWGPVAVAAVIAVVAFVMHLRGQSNRGALAAKIAAGAKVIDVRTVQEYAGGHFEGAVNIPVDTLANRAKTLGAKDGAVVVYCASGGRSAQAAGILRAAGFTDVTNAGGLSNLPRG